jgi:hypothetical protein
VRGSAFEPKRKPRETFGSSLKRIPRANSDPPMIAPIEHPKPTGRGFPEWAAVAIAILLFIAMIFAFGRGFSIW